MGNYVHFNEGEFDCPCCGKNEMNPAHIDKLDMAREISGVPYAITSGYRCAKHNRDVGGVEDSEHTIGEGSDIYTDGSRWRFMVLYGLIKAGFHRIGIAEDFIHAGTDTTKDPYVVWLY